MHHAGGHGTAQLNAEVAVRYPIDGVPAGGGKAQLLGRIKAVQWVGGARQCAGPQRALGVHAGGGILQAAQVAQQHPGVGHQLVAESNGLGTLQMSIAGHDVTGPFFGLVTQHGNQFFNLALDMPAGFPQIQADVQCHLVVAAAAGVQPLTCITHAGSQGLLYKGVYILGVGVNFQCTAVQILQNRVQPLVNIVHILLGDNPLTAQHGRVYQAALDILLNHPRIKADG